MTNQKPAPVAYIGICRKSHPRLRLAAADWRAMVNLSGDYGHCVTCRRQFSWTGIVGRESSTVCGSKCTGATGPSCDCSCVGVNHGGQWA